MSKDTTDFYRSRIWKRCKAAYLTKVNFLCEECQKQGLITPADVVHHIRPITKDTMYDPDITLNHANLMALCRKHHDEVHSWKHNRRYYYDEFGHVITKPDAEW